MKTERGIIKDHAMTVDSLASKVEDTPPEVGLHIESGHATMNTQNSSPEQSESESRLNESTQQQEPRKVNVVAKESLADWGESEHRTIDKQNSSPEHSESESPLNTSPLQQNVGEQNVAAKESLSDWGVVACVFLSNLIAALDAFGFGVFYPYLVEHFEATTAAVGWCSSFTGFFQAAVGLFASYPIKAYGCRLPGAVGSLLFSAGMSLSCFAPNLTTIYFTYGVITGSGNGFAALSTNIIIHQRFTRNRTLASGISFLGLGIGGIMGPILTNHLIQSYGWRGAFLILGAIYAQRIPLCMFFRTPERLISQSKNASGTGSRRISCKVILSYLKETFNFSILRHARYSIYSIAYFLHIFCMFGYLPHTVNRAIHVGLTRDQAVIAASLTGSVSTAIRVPVSIIANHQKVNSSLVFATGMFFAFLSTVAIFINPGIIGTMTSTVLFGIHMGCSATVFTIVAVDLMGVALLPKSLAILQFVAGFARLVSPPLIGCVFDVTRDYNKAFAIVGCMALVSAILMVVLIFVTRCHRKSIAKDINIIPSDKAFPNQPTSEVQG